MQKVYPDYYMDFKCISSECKHNCCIGWEIDIDPETAQIYRNIKGDFGEKLRSNISWSDEPYFILGQNERCPFLNEKNLCEIIINLGEENLCGICSLHPRFTNELPGRTETGIGLCCEAAARLILSKKEPVSLIIKGEKETDDEIIDLRDKVLSALQNRQLKIEKRIDKMLKLCNAKKDEKPFLEWIEFLIKLERLDPLWTDLLCFLKENYNDTNCSEFDEYMSERQHEYENILVYITYRHFANSPTIEQTAEKALFAAFVYKLIYSIGKAFFLKTGELSFETQTEIARMFSSEIEYSDQNLYAILDEMDR